MLSFGRTTETMHLHCAKAGLCLSKPPLLCKQNVLSSPGSLTSPYFSGCQAQ